MAFIGNQAVDEKGELTLVVTEMDDFNALDCKVENLGGKPALLDWFSLPQTENLL